MKEKHKTSRHLYLIYLPEADSVAPQVTLTGVNYQRIKQTNIYI